MSEHVPRQDFEKIKRDYLLDSIRRVLANPGNAEMVAEIIARDWFPTLRVLKTGAFVIEHGTPGPYSVARTPESEERKS